MLLVHSVESVFRLSFFFIKLAFLFWISISSRLSGLPIKYDVKLPPLQAKSPIRTLDELSVNEIIPSPYFPSVVDRERHNRVRDDLHGCHNNSETDIPHSSSVSTDKVMTSLEDVGFGRRRQHRCLVVTARGRSFLYHQVGYLYLDLGPSSVFYFCLAIQSWMQNKLWSDYSC